MKTKVIVLIIILFGIFIYFKSNEEPANLPLDDLVTSLSEENPEYVTYFAEGLSLSDYESILNMNIVKLNSKDSYEMIDYNFEKHLRYDDIISLYNSLNKSEIVNLFKMNKSVDNKDLYYLEIGSGSEAIFLEGGAHAAEIANPLFILKFIIDLVNEYESGSKDTLLNNKIIAIPLVNPDGYEVITYGKETISNKDLWIYKNEIDLEFYKGNANGVDLNRNMPSQTAGLSYKNETLSSAAALEPTVQNRSYFAGYSVGSEPETKGLVYLQTKYYRDIKAYISVHSAGRVIFNGKPNLSDEINNASSNIARKINSINGYYATSKEDEDIGIGTDGTTANYITELLSGFTFSEKTGRLSKGNYGDVIDDYIKTTGVVTLETLSNYTKDLNTIKNEYYDYKLGDIFLEILKN